MQTCIHLLLSSIITGYDCLSISYLIFYFPFELQRILPGGITEGYGSHKILNLNHFILKSRFLYKIWIILNNTPLAVYFLIIPVTGNPCRIIICSRTEKVAVFMLKMALDKNVLPFYRQLE